MQKKNIIILSKSQYIYSTNTLFKALINNNYNVDIVNPLECDIVFDKVNPVIYYEGKILDNIDYVIPRIGAASDYYGLNILETLEKKGIKTLNNVSNIKITREKYKIYKTLKENDLPTPITVLVKSTKNIEFIVEQLKGFPVIIKLSRGSQGKGVMIAETINTLKSIIDSFLLLNEDIILQEFIETKPKYSDIRIYVLNNKILGSTQRINYVDFRSNTHCGGSMSQIKINKNIEELSLKTANCFGLDFCSIDYLPKDNELKILEVNSTPGLEKVETEAKLNLTKSIIEYIEEELCQTSMKI